MPNINFDDGYLKYTINNDPDRVIKVNTADLDFMNRYRKMQDRVKEYCDSLGEVSDDEGGYKFLDDAKVFIEDEIDKLFNAKVSDIVFNGTHPLTIRNGSFMFENFLNAIIPEIEKDMLNEEKKMNKRMKPYINEAKKYTNKE